MQQAWWKEAVVYQVYWRSFYDTNADGYGDLNGIIEKLDYIQSLGATMIWVNPFYASPDKDNGYDIADYFSIMDKAGSMEDFDRLLEEVHRRDMKLMLDVVLNHTSDAHAWFRESRSSRDNPKRDWYIWRDPVNGGPPTNWRSYFHPSAWQFDAPTGQYYLHSFAMEQPDLNWRNPEVRRALYQVLRYWLDKGVDGLRLDAVALLAKPDVFTDVEWPEDIHYLTNHPGLHDYLQEMNREVFRHYDILTVGEAAFVTPQTGLLYVDEQRHELHTLFHFEVLDEMPTWDLPRFKRIQAEWAKTLHGRGTNSQFLNNHDHTRQVTRYGHDGQYRVESAKLLALMLHTLPGIPYIYQGEEIGMTGVWYESIEEYQDIAMRNKYKEEVGKGRNPNEVLRSLQPLSRDNSRTPMQWNDQEHAGFTTGQPWIRVNPNYRELHVEVDLQAEHSIFAFYQTLIQLRKQHPVMIYGDYTDISGDDPQLYIYVRELRDSRLGEARWLIALNHGEQQRELVLPIELTHGAKLLLSNYTDTVSNLAKNVGTIQLRPYEACLYAILG